MLLNSHRMRSYDYVTIKMNFYNFLEIILQLQQYRQNHHALFVHEQHKNGTAAYQSTRLQCIQSIRVYEARQCWFFVFSFIEYLYLVPLWYSFIVFCRKRIYMHTYTRPAWEKERSIILWQIKITSSKRREKQWFYC